MRITHFGEIEAINHEIAERAFRRQEIHYDQDAHEFVVTFGFRNPAGPMRTSRRLLGRHDVYEILGAKLIVRTVVETNIFGDVGIETYTIDRVASDGDRGVITMYTAQGMRVVLTTNAFDMEIIASKKVVAHGSVWTVLWLIELERAPQWLTPG